MLLLVLGWMAAPVVALIAPERRRMRLAVRIAAHVAGLALLGLILDGGQWMTLKPAAASTDAGKLLEIVTASIRIGLVAAGVINSIELVKDVSRFVRVR
jgi:hypothetical protein